MKNIVIYGLAEGLGGVETIILSLINKLVERFSFTIVLSDKDKCGYLHRIPSQVNVVNVTPWGENPRKFKKDFCNLLNECKCDFVWLNACVTSNRELVKAIKSAKRPVKFITHSHGTNYENDGLLKTIVIKSLHILNQRLYNNVASLKLACSSKAAEWFYGKNNTRDVTIIKNGIDTANFKYNKSQRDELRRKWKCEDSFICLHIGRLSAVKNQSYILKIFSELCKLKANALLLIAGTGELYEELQAEAELLGISDKVQFLGLYSRVSDLYNISDVFLLPSLHEGMPLTLVEAQCAGLHCFVSSSISREVKLTRFLTFLPITESPAIWAEQIASQKYESKRELGVNEIIDAGFDIEKISDEVALMIDEIYSK